MREYNLISHLHLFLSSAEERERKNLAARRKEKSLAAEPLKLRDTTCCIRGLLNNRRRRRRNEKSLSSPAGPIVGFGLTNDTTTTAAPTRRTVWCRRRSSSPNQSGARPFVRFRLSSLSVTVSLGFGSQFFEHFATRRASSLFLLSGEEKLSKCWPDSPLRLNALELAQCWNRRVRYDMSGTLSFIQLIAEMAEKVAATK